MERESRRRAHARRVALERAPLRRENQRAGWRTNRDDRRRQRARSNNRGQQSVRGLDDSDPYFRRVSKLASIASRMFARASASVRPWERQPGSAGHSTTTNPSSSRLSVTGKSIFTSL